MIIYTVHKSEHLEFGVGGVPPTVRRIGEKEGTWTLVHVLPPVERIVDAAFRTIPDACIGRTSRDEDEHDFRDVRSVKIYIAVAKACDACGGDMRVVVRRQPLTEEDMHLTRQGQGYCAVIQQFEAETNDGSVEIVNMNPSRGY